MRIVCPTCTAAYDVPDHLMAAGKRTRCARCALEWVPQPPVAGPLEAPKTAPPPPMPSIPPPPRPTIQPPPLTPRNPDRAGVRPRRATSLPVVLALGASVLVLALAVAVGIVWRVVVIHAWPPSERLFTWLGLA